MSQVSQHGAPPAGAANVAAPDVLQPAQRPPSLRARRNAQRPHDNVQGAPSPQVAAQGNQAGPSGAGGAAAGAGSSSAAQAGAAADNTSALLMQLRIGSSGSGMRPGLGNKNRAAVAAPFQPAPAMLPGQPQMTLGLPQAPPAARPFAAQPQAAGRQWPPPPPPQGIRLAGAAQAAGVQAAAPAAVRPAAQPTVRPASTSSAQAASQAATPSALRPAGAPSAQAAPSAAAARAEGTQSVARALTAAGASTAQSAAQARTAASASAHNSELGATCTEAWSPDDEYVAKVFSDQLAAGCLTLGDEPLPLPQPDIAAAIQARADKIQQLTADLGAIRQQHSTMQQRRVQTYDENIQKFDSISKQHTEVVAAALSKVQQIMLVSFPVPAKFRDKELSQVFGFVELTHRQARELLQDNVSFVAETVAFVKQAAAGLQSPLEGLTMEQLQVLQSLVQQRDRAVMQLLRAGGQQGWLKQFQAALQYWLDNRKAAAVASSQDIAAAASSSSSVGSSFRCCSVSSLVTCHYIRSLSRDGGGGWRLRIKAADQHRIDQQDLFKLLENKAMAAGVRHPDMMQLSLRNAAVVAAHNGIITIRELVAVFGKVLMSLAEFEAGMYAQYADELRNAPNGDAQLLQKVEAMQQLTAAVHEEAVMFWKQHPGLHPNTWEAHVKAEPFYEFTGTLPMKDVGDPNCTLAALEPLKEPTTVPAAKRQRAEVAAAGGASTRQNTAGGVQNAAGGVQSTAGV